MPSAIDPPYPTMLMTARMAARKTRAQIVGRCRALRDEDSDSYVTISSTTLRSLELGKSKPRMRTAVTLAKVLDANIESLFPGGIDSTPRNPLGIRKK